MEDVAAVIARWLAKVTAIPANSLKTMSANLGSTILTVLPFLLAYWLLDPGSGCQGSGRVQMRQGLDPERSLRAASGGRCPRARSRSCCQADG